jgi:hypothetical protein
MNKNLEGGKRRIIVSGLPFSRDDFQIKSSKGNSARKEK